MILSCQNISKSFGTDEILKNVSFHIEENEKAAVVGINGAGKSTLLKIIMKQENPDEGEVTLAKDKTIGYLAQYQDVSGHHTIYEEVLDSKRDIIEMEERLRDMETQMNTLSGEALEQLLDTYHKLSHEFEQVNGYAYRSEVTGILKGLGFSDEDLSKQMSELSGGQKTRVSLGKLLVTKPDVLLLDEPTNHMDIVGKEALEQMLREYEGTVLFVSHDRYFISRIATGILEFSESGVKQYAMSYEEYLAEKQKEMEISGKGRGMSQSARYVSGNDTQNSVGNEKHNQHQSGIKTDADVPTLTDVFDKKTYYNPGKIRSRLHHQLEKYEKMLEESEEKLAEIKMQFMDPELASDYPKLMELQNALDAEEKNQESLLERMLETETELAEFEEE